MVSEGYVTFPELARNLKIDNISDSNTQLEQALTVIYLPRIALRAPTSYHQKLLFEKPTSYL